MRRNLVIAFLPFALGGCLPLPITIASTAFSGISYLTTGKSTSDHVLSATMEQDCALTRPVFGAPICREPGPDGEGRTNTVAVAHYPGDRDDGLSNEARLAARTRGALKVTEVADDSHQIAIAPQFLAPPPRVSVAGIVVTKDQVVAAPRSRALPIAADNSWASLVPPKTIQVAPLAAPVPSVTRAPAPGLVEFAPPEPAKAALAKPAPVTSASPAGAVATAPAADSAGRSGADRWVVIGSFKDVARARTMASRFADRAPTILEARVAGDRWHRVVIGPLTASAAKGIRDGLGRIDGRQPWVVKLAQR